MKVINPYNFVPLKSGGPDRNLGYPGLHRLHENRYSGLLVCALTAISPLVSLDHGSRHGRSPAPLFIPLRIATGTR